MRDFKTIKHRLLPLFPPQLPFILFNTQDTILSYSALKATLTLDLPCHSLWPTQFFFPSSTIVFPFPGPSSVMTRTSPECQ